MLFLGYYFLKSLEQVNGKQAQVASISYVMATTTTLLVKLSEDNTTVPEKCQQNWTRRTCWNIVMILLWKRRCVR